MRRINFPVLYQFPSLLILLDDKVSFLHNVELALGPDTLYRLFSDPARCLKFLNDDHDKRSSLSQRALGFHQNYGANSLLHVDLGVLETATCDPSRFSTPTCVVADYQMPKMNGLEFFKQLQDPHIGKILLTGVADRNTAVEAFNAGIIDRFVMKGDTDSLTQTLEHVAYLQTDYFVQTQNSLIMGLEGISPIFADSVLMEFVQTKLLAEGFVEHYIATNPAGYVAVKPGGEHARLVVANQKELDRQSNYAAQNNAPASITTGLQRGHSVAYFYELATDYEPGEYSWTSYLAEAHKIEGEVDSWYVGILQNIPAPADFTTTSCFETVLASQAG